MLFTWLAGHKYTARDSQLFNTNKTKGKQNSEGPRINIKDTKMFPQQSLNISF